LTALRLSPRQVFPAPGTLGLSGLWTALGRLPDAFKKETSLWFPAFQPVLIKPLRLSEGMFAHLKKQDILLHHPYESFDGYVQFIRTACADPNVTSVQQTFYRTDALSPILEALKKAASSKRVRVVIELRARFDEMNNLRLAEDLRRAGVEVAFGLPRLKVHAKVALVTRQENGTEQLYTHLSTGNYNAVTARAYEDLALLTSNPEIGNDAQHFFDSVCHGEVPSGFKSLVPAPARLHRLLLQLIETETEAAHDGKPAYVFAKVNGLVDPRIVESLYQASQAGVQVDLVVRGACSLIPGVPGLSDNIRVVSLVDRFLEHSRIYYFAQANRMYLSSADWMPRNFFSRLELAFPVLDPQLFDTIRLKIIPAYLADTVKGRELTSQGTWRRRSSADTANPRFQKAEIPTFAHPFQAQTYFQDLTKPLFGHLKGTVIVKSDIVNATNGTWDAEK